ALAYRSTDMYRPYTSSGYNVFRLLFILAVFCGLSSAAPARPKRKPVPAKRPAPVRTQVRADVNAPIIRGGPWTEPTYADSTAGDYIDGEDLEVRRAAVEALGPYNGSVIAVDAETGRILTMVNQKIALGMGVQPCSTIKVSVALAGLREK